MPEFPLAESIAVFETLDRTSPILSEISSSIFRIGRRVNKRFVKMIDKGAVEEVKHLLKLNFNKSLPVMRAHGVPEISLYLNKKIDLKDCINKGQQVTRNYVKRQHTWWGSTNLRIHQQIKHFPDEIDINSLNFK